MLLYRKSLLHNNNAAFTISEDAKVAKFTVFGGYNTEAGVVVFFSTRCHLSHFSIEWKCIKKQSLCARSIFRYSVSVNVYWVIANIEPIPPISAKNFFHLFSEFSHSSGITSVAPTYTKVPATMASMMASTIGAANSFTIIPRTTPIGPIALKTDRKVIISDLGMPDFKNATRRAIDSAGCMTNVASCLAKISEGVLYQRPGKKLVQETC